MMTSTYTSPELIRYGAIAALTASSIKCTPAGDANLSPTAHLHGIDHGSGVWEPLLHDGEVPGGSSPQCTNFGDLTI